MIKRPSLTTALTLKASLLVVPCVAGSQLPPEAVVLGIRKARAHQLAGRDAEQVAELEKLIEQNPDNATVLLELLDAYSQLKNPERIERIRELLRSRLAAPQNLPASVLADVTVDRRLGATEVRQAAAELERRAVEAGSDPALLRSALLGYERLDDLVKRRELVVRLLAAEPALRWRYELLQIDHESGRWEDVLHSVQALREQPIDQTWVSLFEIEALDQLARYDDCAAALDRLPLGRNTPEVVLDQLLRLAIVMLDAGRAAAAEKLIGRLHEHKPADVRFARLKAYLFGTVEQQVALEAQLFSSVIENQSVEVLVNDAAARMVRGDPQGAILLLERATTLSPENVVAWYNLVVAATKIERWPLVESAASRVIELDPKHARAYMMRGQARVKSQRFDDGMQDARRALGLDAALKPAWFVLYLGAKGKQDEAAASEYLQNSK